MPKEKENKVIDMTQDMSGVWQSLEENNKFENKEEENSLKKALQKTAFNFAIFLIIALLCWKYFN